ncbi:tetraacyldisaccharide 4'-kinase [Marinicella rhabdoformis]|uniref:tetraacyldisaccharide 4'-kinase n=1 Tax=Marinicella rhabdoformis TaxID=2580566 RepID=UPI001C550BBF|nr:tetraacyldisaccharide 4'-kinase [Marinicella rhabdoformis]
MLSKAFQKIAALRRKVYRLGLLRSTQLKVPVIIVGNITAGGGGKTPMVIWLVNHLKTLGYKPGIISRGYGGKRKVEPMFVTPHADAHASGDEALLMAQKTQAPVMVGKDRAKAGKQLIAQYNVNVIVSDDGMQHYALKRDIEIVMLDAKWQTGNNMFLPAGPLREPLTRLDEADIVIYKGSFPDKHHYELGIKSIYPLGHPSKQIDITTFRSQKIHAVAGIANPNSFFNLLSKEGLAIIKKPLPDHHEIAFDDLCFDDDYPIMITEKDAVKCDQFDSKNIWVVQLKIIMKPDTIHQINGLIEGLKK